MRTAIFSDIHGNSPALAAVLNHAIEQNCEEYWFLGDVFGYGPLPITCIAMLDRVKPSVWLMGNHDLSTLLIWNGATLDDEVVHLMTPNDEQKWTAKWHASQLKVGLEECRINQLLAEPTWKKIKPGIFTAHGAVLHDDPSSPQNIDTHSYVKPWQPTASRMLDFMNSKQGISPPRLIVVGHYHQPMLGVANDIKPYDISWDAGISVYDAENGCSGSWPLPQAGEEKTAIVNPGSVGLPRFVEGDTRAAYAILDEKVNKSTGDTTASIEFHRIEYDERELRAARLLSLPPKSRHGAEWWLAIAPILDEWTKEEF